MTIRFLALTVAILATGCTHKFRDYEQPAMEEFETNDLQTASLQRFDAAEPVQQWWQTFNDAQLSALVEDALQNNLDIQVALANIDEARAVVSGTRLDRFPTVEAEANAVRQRLSEEGIQGVPLDRTINNYDAGFDAFWEVDLFGRVRQGIRAAEANLEARRADAQAVYVSVAAEVARTYMELLGAQYQLNIARRNVENQRETFELSQRLADGGRGTELDIERARTQLTLTESTIPTLRAAVNAAINRLGVLTGKTPDSLHQQLTEIRPLPSLPESVSVGDSASLLRRRPDVRAAERELAVSVAEYNVRVADLYPSISLQGSVGFSSISSGDLFGDSASTFVFGPSIRWAAFNMGRVRAAIRQADARAQADLARFEQTVLLALEEIDTAMVNFSREEERRASLIQAARSSANAARIARERYDAGVSPFLDVLDAERTLLDAEDRLAVSETDLALDLVAVYKALGGGWEIVSRQAVSDSRR